MKKSKIAILLLAGSLLLPGTLPAAAPSARSSEDAMVKYRAEERQKARGQSKKKENRTQETTAAPTAITNAADVSALSEVQRVAIIGRMCQQDYATSGILASVSAAQCILESGYLGTSLAVDANNCFGMKVNLSNNQWQNSAWDGKSVYTKNTWEEYDGKIVTISADFRKYDSVQDSIADHSAYLLGAKKGNQLRYAGLKGETDYKKAIQIIKDGGYATDSAYVSKICNIIEKFNLTQYDTLPEEENHNEKLLEDVRFYRIRKSWRDEDSQLGAYIDLNTAKRNCKKGYTVYDWKGKAVYQNKANVS